MRSNPFLAVVLCMSQCDDDDYLWCFMHMVWWLYYALWCYVMISLWCNYLWWIYVMHFYDGCMMWHDLCMLLFWLWCISYAMMSLLCYVMDEFIYDDYVLTARCMRMIIRWIMICRTNHVMHDYVFVVSSFSLRWRDYMGSRIWKDQVAKGRRYEGEMSFLCIYHHWVYYGKCLWPYKYRIDPNSQRIICMEIRQSQTRNVPVYTRPIMSSDPWTRHSVTKKQSTSSKQVTMPHLDHSSL